MADSSATTTNLSDGGVVELTRKITVVTIILLLFVFVFIFCLHLYAKWYLHSRWSPTATTRGRGRRNRRRLDFANGERAVMSLRQGLDSSILKTLPIVVFDPKEFEEGLECAVCLSEVCEGEKARLLPKCNYGFHVECIDMWFESHSNCPLCRNAVSNETIANLDGGSETTLEVIVEEVSLEGANLPTNVLFWGDESRVSTLGSHQGSGSGEPESLTLAINVAREVNGEEEEVKLSSPMASRFTSLKRLLSGNSVRMNNPRNCIGEASTSSRHDGVLVTDVERGMNEEEVKSPMGSRFKTLKRLLSGNSRSVNLSSPRGSDIEQGGKGQS